MLGSKQKDDPQDLAQGFSASTPECSQDSSPPNSVKVAEREFISFWLGAVVVAVDDHAIEVVADRPPSSYAAQFPGFADPLASLAADI